VSEDEQQQRADIDNLKGADRLEKAVALHIHAINTPVMILEGYLPENAREPLTEKAYEKILRSLEKVKAIIQELKAELVQFRTDK
jgi:alanine racemase